MNINELFLRFIAGGSLIVLITLLAKTRYPFLAGIMVLFPAVTLIGFFFLGQTVDTLKLKEIALFSMYALPTTFIFLLTFYFLQGRYALTHTLLFSVMAWFAAAGILIFVKSNLVKL